MLLATNASTNVFRNGKKNCLRLHELVHFARCAKEAVSRNLGHYLYTVGKKHSKMQCILEQSNISRPSPVGPLKVTAANIKTSPTLKDLHLSLTLLQNRPSSYLAQRVDSLPHDMRARVKSYIADRQAEKAGEAGEAAAAATTSARKITVPIMDEGWRERASFVC